MLNRVRKPRRDENRELTQLLAVALGELSGSYRSIVGLLEERGIRGIVQDPAGCPVRNFIAIHLGERPDVEIYVDSASICLETTSCLARMSIVGTALSRVIQCFDERLLPQLIVPSSEPPFEDSFDPLMDDF